MIARRELLTKGVACGALLLTGACASGTRAVVQADDYASKLQAALGEPVNPLAAHRAGLEEARTLQARADRLLRAQGLTRGSVAERLRALARNPRHLYSDDDAGRNQAVADMNAALALARAVLPKAFGDLPPLTAEVRRMTPEDEARGRAGYRDPDSGAYYVDLKNIRARPRWTLPSVVHHELLPGHMLHLAYEARAKPQPLRLPHAGPYSEAWAIYAERLADELGLFAEDPLGAIGYLQWMLFRLARLIADTGIHAKSWTREQAIERMTELQGESIAFITIKTDVDRMFRTPGAAAAQALGYQRLVRLREQARAKQGSGFDLARFHRGVLLGRFDPPSASTRTRP